LIGLCGYTEFTQVGIYQRIEVTLITLYFRLFYLLYLLMLKNTPDQLAKLIVI